MKASLNALEKRFVDDLLATIIRKLRGRTADVS